MFDKNAPAENINVLTDYLKKNHKDCYVYRGQTTDYDTLLPSFYRNKLKSFRLESSNNSLNIIQQRNRFNYFIHYNPANDSKRNKAKRITMNQLMENFGKSLGNVLAQQYGINSECLDITSDPNVAAFFATHQYPHYLNAVESDNLGVIYRIINNNDNNSLQHAGIELALSANYLVQDNKPIPLLYSSERYQYSDDEFKELNNKYNFETNITCTRPIIADYNGVKQIITTYFAEKYPDVDIESLFYTSRISKQKAGFVIPSFIFESYVPANLQIISFLDNRIEAYNPSFVIHKEKVGIEDILIYPNIERFYFRHTKSIESHYSREELWPSVEVDYFYNLLYRWCSDGCKNYIQELNINIDDMKMGILDKGFY
ncbi:MAG TPA: hypothetical protein DCP93_13525 [Lachnospiraceae bacterium]|jgi:hypothetical protein|nr:hypothetical protein [Lachnospiraceae bacterium]